MGVSHGSPSRWLAPLSFAVGAGLFVALTAGHSSRLTQSFHGLFHSAYVVQIANGILPPTSPLSMEAPATSYWTWHAVLAGIVRVLGITPFEASLLVNALALAVTLQMLWVLAGRAGARGALRLGACLAAFVLLDPFGLGRAFLQASGLVNVAQQAPTPSVRELMPASHWLGVPLEPRVGHPLSKFLNFTSFGAATALFVTGLALATGRGRPLARAIGVATTTFVGTLFNTLVGAALLALGASLAVSMGAEAVAGRPSHTRAGPGRRPADDLAPALGILIGLALAAPMVLDFAGSYGASIRFHTAPAALAQRAVALGWALAPSLPIYLAAAWDWRRLRSETRVLWLTGLALAAAMLLASIPVSDPNEYKLGLLHAFPTVIVLVDVLRIRARRLSPATRRRASGAVGALLLVAGAGGAFATGWLYRSCSWGRDDPFVYRESLVDLATAGAGRLDDLREVFAWLRTETPAEAYVLERPVPRNHLLTSVVAQRRTVAALPSHYTRQIRYQETLAGNAERVVRKLGRCEPAARHLARLLRVPAPWPDELYALVAWQHPAEADRSACRRDSPGLELAYENDHYGVFRIRTAKAEALALPAARDERKKRR